MLLKQFVQAHNNELTGFNYDFGSGNWANVGSLISIWSVGNSILNKKRNDYVNGSNPYYLYLALGSSTTTPTFNDYSMEESDVTSQLTYINGVVSRAIDKTILSLTQVFKNETANSITVNEIGLGYCYAYSATNKRAILIARKVLDTPVTIAPGETYNFTYSINVA